MSKIESSDYVITCLR